VGDVKLEIGREYPPDGEAAAIAELRALHLMVHKVQPGPSQRGEHPKQHAGVWATLSVDAQIPDALRVGLFAAPGTYKALIRFSNGRGPDDTKPEAHGMAIKVLVPEGDGPPRMQDFILADHPVFFAQNVQHAFEFLAASVKGVPIEELLPKYPKLVGFTSVATTSLLAMTYWSQTPYKLGHGAVKYRVAPSAGSLDGVRPLGAGPDCLRDSLFDQLSVRQVGARFDLSVISQTDADAMPIEDPTVEWTSAPVRVATISIDPQTFNSAEQMAYFANLTWNPWHALPQHRPLGGINRARRLVYEDSAGLRHQTTGTGPVVPTLTESGR